jgi:hypothetical protein
MYILSRKYFLQFLFYVSFTVFTVTEDFEVTVEDHKTRAREEAKASLQECKDKLDASLSPEVQVDLLAACMEQTLERTMRKTDDEVQFQSSIRKQMGHLWAEYACRDSTNVTTTVAVVNSTWSYTDPEAKRKRSTKHEVNVLFESEYNKITRVQKFITFPECEALQAATTGSSDGSLVLPLGSRAKNKIVDQVMAKIESFVTSMTGMTATLRKDPLMDVRLVTASEDCAVGTDGTATCAAARQQPERIVINTPNTVATLMLLCTAPTEGGQIYFTKTGTILLPKDFVGSAILLLHEDNLQREEDPFVDEFVVCPVQQGSMLTFVENLAK